MKLKLLLPLLILVVSIGYGFGEHFGWWDSISGRRKVELGLNVLLDTKVPFLEKKNHPEEFFAYFDKDIDVFPENIIKKDPGDKLMSIPIESIEPVDSISDLKRWIDQKRNNERFAVSIILIGVLSIIAFLNELWHNKAAERNSYSLRSSESTT